MSNRTRLSALFEDAELKARYKRLRAVSSNVRNSVYHLTNKCNLRCKGCWFFERDFDQASREARDIEKWRDFVEREAQRGITSPLLIGGEPMLYLDRIALFQERMPYVTISSNGEIPLPKEGFETVTIAISLFGGGAMDDQIRAIRSNGQRFSGLFQKALDNYRNDPRAGFVYGISPASMPYMEETVQRIRDNGQRLLFNYYIDYQGQPNADDLKAQRELLDEALRLRDLYSDTISSHPYFIEAMILGKTSWGKFGRDSCAAVSNDHPDNQERLANGNPVLPKFNAWAADAESLVLCCTSGDCDYCHDSQSVSSWLLCNAKQFMNSKEDLLTWIELSESYFSQFIWSPYHPQHAAHYAKVS